MTRSNPFDEPLDMLPECIDRLEFARLWLKVVVVGNIATVQAPVRALLTGC